MLEWGIIPGYTRARRSGMSRARSVFGGLTWASAGAGVFHRVRSNGLVEVDGTRARVSAAWPRWLCRRWPKTGGDGFEHAGVGAC